MTIHQPEPPAPEMTGPSLPNNRSMDRHEGRKPISSSLAPIKADRWGYDQARHLLWRAGFGGSPEQVRTVASWGPQKAVEYIVDYDDVRAEKIEADAFNKDIMRPASEAERAEAARARRAGDEDAVARLRAMRQEAERVDRGQMRDMQKWWLKRMIETPRPLEEKMTLFWHGHFATSYRTIEDSYHMFAQNRLFRRNAVGNFGKLLYEIIRDPAMIAYLDNNDSRKGRPNENLARELMELFSLGVGNYSEQDIKEGARALTGYSFYDDEFTFQKNNHDTGEKKILGRNGTLDGDDFVSAILRKPACARHIAGKLYRLFVADVPTGRPEIDKPAESVIRQLASTLVANRYEVRPVLRKLFLSDHFYEQPILREQVKSPAEVVVGAVRSLLTPTRDLGVLTDAMNLMGQNIFYPPSVKGWDGGRTWINTATLFIRQNILCFLLTGKTPKGFDALARTETYDAAAFISGLEPSGETGGRAADSPFARSNPTDQELSVVVEQMLRFTLGASSPGNHEILMRHFRAAGNRVDQESVVSALLLVTAMPEYQLC
ncbi:MAG: DUF1800 domain-containing protein [Phycisphaerales bacterium]|nr:DUF1800 domain-containing protein [Phycisphaerales bacterium]